MGNRSEATGYVALLQRWVGWVARRPVSTLAVVALLTLASSAVTFARFQMNSDTGSLIRQDAPFRERYAEFQRAFPQFDETLLVVVTADGLDLATEAAGRLAAALRERPEHFSSVYTPTLEPFTQSRALYYLEPEDLEEWVDALATAQPALAELNRNPSIVGVAALLDRALERLGPDDWPPVLDVLATRLSQAAEGLLSGEGRPVSWGDALSAGNELATFHVIVVQGRSDFSEALSSEATLDEIRELARGLGLGPDSGVSVRLTGMVPLEHEELASVRDSVQLAALVSIALLLVILGLGLRSARLIVASLASLFIGLSWTAALGLLVVGEFNTISITFSVLFVGLGIDIAIHFGLRYREDLHGGAATPEALVAATRGVGGPVSLCAVTSAVGFLSFVPTEYRGLADLGLIAGLGMGCALAASFTALPALMAILGGGGREPRPARLLWAGDALRRHARPILFTSLLGALGAAWIARDAHFDFSTLGLKNPRSEAMETLRFLQDHDIGTEYSLTVLTDGPDDAEALADALRALPSVASVQTPADRVPAAQEEKAELLEEARWLLGPALDPVERAAPPSAAERVAAVRGLERRLRALDPEEVPPALVEPLTRLADALDELLARPNASDDLARWEELVVRFLDTRLAWLRDALLAEPFAFDDLPAEERARLVAPDGRSRLIVIPRHDLSDFSALRHFLAEVTAVAPHATGRPVVEAGIGEIVVHAFRQALAIAAFCILLTLWLVQRSVRDAALVLVPLAVAGLFTLATGVLADLPFNMANVIALPLLLGLGVDNGIHVMTRFRESGSLGAVMGSTTPRAVLLSTLTTLGTFGALALSSHAGIRSMGLLLMIGMLYLLAATLVVLPALLVWIGDGPAGSLTPPRSPARDDLARVGARGREHAHSLAGSPRIAFWLRYLALFVAIASAERIGIALWLERRTPAQWDAWLGALAHGVVDDLVTGIVVGVPFLLLLVLGPRRPRIAASLSTLFTALWLFLALASLYYFSEFETRFNRLVLDYLEFPHEAFGFLAEAYRIGLALLPIAVVTMAIEAGLGPARRRALAAPVRRAERRRELLFALALAATAAVPWLGDPVEGAGRLAGDLARNPLHSLFRAATDDPHTWSLPALPDDRALTLARASVGSRETGFTGAGLERRVPAAAVEAAGAARPHVVVVIEESMGTRQARSRLANGRAVAPELERLAERSVSFPHVFATGTRTARGIEAIVASFPPLLGVSVIRRPEGRGMHSIASVLRANGYETAFLYGGNARFDDMGPFCRSAGFDHVWDLEGFAEPGFTTVWGAADEYLFGEALRRLDARGPEDPPLLLVMLTVSNHPPFTVPDGRVALPPSTSPQERAVAYADWALGDFLRRAGSRPWFGDTLFAVVADHDANSHGDEAIPLAAYRVPFLLHWPGRLEPRRESVLGSSLDVAPTLLGRLGIAYESPFFGVDLLAVEPGHGRALVSHFDRLGRVDRDGLVVLSRTDDPLFYPLRSPEGRLGAPRAPDAEKLQLAIAPFQTAHRLLYSGAYHP